MPLFPDTNNNTPSDYPRDWGEASDAFDLIKDFIEENDLSPINEAETRLKVIDRMLEEVLGWTRGHLEKVKPEESLDSEEYGYVDYVLRSGDFTIVLEAKRYGKAFPSPSNRRERKLFGSSVYQGDTKDAVDQVIKYGTDKNADVAIISNGECWIYFSMHELHDEPFAKVIFPFKDGSQAEELFNTFCISSVDLGSLANVSNRPIINENRLSYQLSVVNGRLDRNNVADLIISALDRALYADALLDDEESLNNCYVLSNQRTKYDNQLRIHLTTYRPNFPDSMDKVKRHKPNGHLKRLAEQKTSRIAPPVTLLLGAVGSGKTTYLRFFELISGHDVITEHETLWIYIDFKAMGRTGSPRQFIYQTLLEYIEKDYGTREDVQQLVENAYEDKTNALKSGPLSRLFNTNRERFWEKVTEDIILPEYQQKEPYVDRIFSHLAATTLCVIVLDNVDLYEDDDLETEVFSEGLAVSKRVKANVVVSMRDTTYARHRNTATINAYTGDLKVLWLDPPNIKSVISKRLTYSKKILEAQSGETHLGSFRIELSDLGHFFDTVQKSVLDGTAGHFIESMSDGNVRKGLTLITNFMKSGHIEANRAVINFISTQENTYTFPFHEVFKGSILGDWRHFREGQAECINVFDSRLGVSNLLLLRLVILRELSHRASRENTKEVLVKELVNTFSGCGASEAHVLNCLRQLQQDKLIRSITAEDIHLETVVVITQSGGYMAKILYSKFVYVEECMHDTAITDSSTWQKLSRMTNSIERETNRLKKNDLRRKRIKEFLDYLAASEKSLLSPLRESEHLYAINSMQQEVMETADYIVNATKRYSRD